MNKNISEFKLPYSYYEWVIGARSYFMETDFKNNPPLMQYFYQIDQNLNKISFKVESHENFAREVKYFQSWASFDQKYVELLNTVDIVFDGVSKKLLENKESTIYCTYHVGSYRIINMYLIAKQIPFVLITDKQYIDKQGDETYQDIEKLNNQINTGTFNFDFQIINAENRNSILQIRDYIKRGYSLVFYIDGNSGVPLRDNKNLEEVRLLDEIVLARKGIAYISSRFNLPIIPVIAPREDWGRIKLIFKKPILQENQDSTSYIKQTTKKLFLILEHYIKKYPAQWEGWLYLEKFLPQETIENRDFKPRENTLSFNFQRYHILKFNTVNVLFDKLTLASIEMSNELFTLLTYIQNNNVKIMDSYCIDNITYQQRAIADLLENQIILK
jgi:KDO2-lipid IV(A) lauroyltransferase